eukprot:2706352-Amphidinium_carterae.2
MHTSNRQLREQLEQEALEYQHEVSKSTEQQVQVKLQQEVGKIQAEMTRVIQESAASRSQLKAQYEQELGSVRAAYEQTNAARIDGEQALASMREAGERQLSELGRECGHWREQHVMK